MKWALPVGLLVVLVIALPGSPCVIGPTAYISAEPQQATMPVGASLTVTIKTCGLDETSTATGTPNAACDCGSACCRPNTYINSVNFLTADITQESVGIFLSSARSSMPNLPCAPGPQEAACRDANKLVQPNTTRHINLFLGPYGLWPDGSSAFTITSDAPGVSMINISVQSLLRSVIGIDSSNNTASTTEAPWANVQVQRNAHTRQAQQLTLAITWAYPTPRLILVPQKATRHVHQPLQLTAVLVDANGLPIPPAAVAFTSYCPNSMTPFKLSSTSATTDERGWATTTATSPHPSEGSVTATAWVPTTAGGTEVLTSTPAHVRFVGEADSHQERGYGHGRW